MNKNTIYGKDKAPSPVRKKKNDPSISIKHADKFISLTIPDGENKKTIVVPSADYVKYLEDQIKDMNRTIHLMESKIRTLNIAVNRKRDK